MKKSGTKSIQKRKLGSACYACWERRMRLRRSRDKTPTWAPFDASRFLKCPVLSDGSHMQQACDTFVVSIFDFSISLLLMYVFFPIQTPLIHLISHIRDFCVFETFLWFIDSTCNTWNYLVKSPLYGSINKYPCLVSVELALFAPIWSSRVLGVWLGVCQNPFILCLFDGNCNVPKIVVKIFV